MSNENDKPVTRSELAAILRDSGGPVGIAAWAESVAARLAPATEGAEEPPRPAPASTPAFDAKAWAEKMVKVSKGTDGVQFLLIFHNSDADDRNTVLGPAWKGADDIDKQLTVARKHIAAALTAAHAAGLAAGDAAGYARGREAGAPKGCVINEDGEVLTAELVSAAPTPFNPRNYETEWLWRLKKKPAAPDAKEASP